MEIFLKPRRGGIITTAWQDPDVATTVAQQVPSVPMARCPRRPLAGFKDDGACEFLCRISSITVPTVR